MTDPSPYRRSAPLFIAVFLVVIGSFFAFMFWRQRAEREANEKFFAMDRDAMAQLAAPPTPPAPSSAWMKAACIEASQCPGGGCAFEPGCRPITGYCGPPVAPCVVARPYCGCDGKTFSTCPPPHMPYAHEGACSP